MLSNSQLSRSLFALLCTGGLLAIWLQTAGADDQPTSGTMPHHIRVIWHENPATTAIIAWTTVEAGRSHTLEFTVGDSDEWATVECSNHQQFDGRVANGPEPYVHFVRLQDLQPATKVRLKCTSDDKVSRELHFFTAPDDDRPIALLWGGDSRSGWNERKAVNRMMADIVAEQSAAGRPEVLALAHGGDFIVRGTDLRQWLAWLSHHEQTTTSDGRLLPVIPTRGNHDMGPIFNQVFAFPKDDTNYFATSLSGSVRLATLNTETVTGGDQRDWLAEELKTNRWHYTWYLAQYHKPAFPAVKFPSGALTNWVPLFDEYQIDLGCEADGHVIKRTPPIRGTKVDPAGVVYIGEGGLGVGQRTPKTGRWYLQDTADQCGSAHHVHLLSFHPDRLEVRVIQVGGEVFDEFTLKPRKPQ